MYMLAGEYLAQYGVKGRSGRRRGFGSGKRKPQRKLSKREMMARQAEARKKQLAAIKKMNSKELTEVVERNRLEALLKEQLNLNPVEKKKYIDLKQMGANAFSKSGEKMAEQILSAATAKAINKLLGSEVIFSNNKKK